MKLGMDLRALGDHLWTLVCNMTTCVGNCILPLFLQVTNSSVDNLQASRSKVCDYYLAKPLSLLTMERSIGQLKY